MKVLEIWKKTCYAAPPQKCIARRVLMEVLTDESEERAIVAWCQMPPTCAGTLMTIDGTCFRTRPPGFHCKVLGVVGSLPNIWHSVVYHLADLEFCE